MYIYFDFDDTITPTQKAYDEVNLEVAKYIQNCAGMEQKTMEDILSLQHKIDVENTIKHGLFPYRFPLSWVQTYQEICKALGINSEVIIEKEIENRAYGIFTKVIHPFEGVHEALELIRSLGYEMNILTAGHDEIQNKRIDDADVRKYFDNIYVVPEKKPHVMKEIIKDRDPSLCVMIGNSLRSDIHPALSNGMRAIHIQAETWAYDKYDVDKSNPNYFPIQNLGEVPEILQQLSSQTVSK